MNLNLNEKQFNALAAGLLIITAILIYSNSFKVPLQFDDIYHITQKPAIRDISNYTKFSAWNNINARPLPMFTLAMNYRWGEANPTGYHVLNLILHIMTGWLVYLLTLQILSLKNLKLGPRLVENRLIFALLAALLFIAHPLQTQAVTYIIQRITVLATLFYLLSVYFFIRGRVTQIENGDLKESGKYYLGTLIAFIFALLSKQIAVTLPLALLLVEFYFIRGANGKINKQLITIFASIVGIFIIIGLAIEGLPREAEGIPRHIYLFTSLKVLVQYLQMFILPINQNLDHDIVASVSIFGLKEIGSLAILGGLIYLAYRLFKSNPLISFGIAWFFVTLLIEQSIIPIKDFMFEHRVYLPSFGLILASLSALFTYLPAVNWRNRMVPGAIFLTVFLILISGIASNARNKVWQSDLDLWSDVVKKSPNKARPYLWQGIAYSNRGRFEEAKASIDKSIELLPNFPMAYYNRGNVYKDLGDFKKSLQDYNKAIELDSAYTIAYFNRGVVKSKIRRYKSAIEDYNVTLEYDPDNTNALYNRGNAYRNLRKYKQAIEDYTRAIEINPSYTLAIFNRGLSKAGMKQHLQAVQDFDLALRLDQNNHLIYNGKGVSLYQLGRHQESIANYDAALRVKPDFGQAYYNRGFTKYFGLNDKPGGCADWQLALRYNYSAAKGVLEKYCANVN
jgi:tetratricopeptide (TPR) repeat protein